jgi:large subunit ribosomal protein L25
MANQPLAIAVDARNSLGTSTSRRLRRDNMIPAVIYGHGGAATPVTVKLDDLNEVIHHPGLISLDITGNGSKSAIVKEVQHHPISSKVLHIDFQEVKADEVITSTVLLEPVGTPAGAAHGGQLQQVTHEVEVRCLPGDMVEAVEVDVSGMDVEDIMHLSDIVLPEGLELSVADAEVPVFQVRIPQVETEDEGDEEAEVQVIGEEASEEGEE